MDINEITQLTEAQIGPSEGGKRDTSPISYPKRVKAKNYGQAPYSGELRDIALPQAASEQLGR